MRHSRKSSVACLSTRNKVCLQFPLYLSGEQAYAKSKKFRQDSNPSTRNHDVCRSKLLLGTRVHSSLLILQDPAPSPATETRSFVMNAKSAKTRGDPRRVTVDIIPTAFSMLHQHIRLHLGRSEGKTRGSTQIHHSTLNGGRGVDTEIW